MPDSLYLAAATRAAATATATARKGARPSFEPNSFVVVVVGE